ncbi:MAG: glycosyltransferase [Candidatus Aminicenantes bacterium]|nr:glycosyltransferase [Candidatus Aminicenantes bacterium]
MKILFSGYHNPFFVSLTEYSENAIAKLNHTCISFDDRKFIFPGRLRQRARFLHKWELQRINNKLISLVCQNKPDLCLISGGHRIFPETIQKIKKKGIKTALWTIDVPLTFQPIIQAAPFYDYMFCGGTEAQELLAEAGITETFWLPFACDPEVHKPVDVNIEEKKKWGSDITFVGSYYPNRHEVFEKINDFNLKLWGPGWNKLPPDSPLRPLARDIQLTPEDWGKIYCSSKIVVVIHYKNEKIPCYQASPKVYETLACKSFLLVDDQQDVKSLFEDGKHLVIFKDPRDLREKIDYYLSHPEERKQIALHGYQEAIQNHTYVHRIKRLIKTMYPDQK